jgi:hypothetical protein
MGAGGIAVAVTLAFLASATCGAVTLLMLRSTRLGRATSFGWGAALGPIGIAIAISVAAASKARPRPAPEPWA